MGEEPDNIDKEFLRLWFRENCDPYNDKVSYLILVSSIYQNVCASFGAITNCVDAWDLW